MKNLQQLKLLINSQGYVPLEESKEGHLRGGFSLLSEGSVVNDCHCGTLTNNCSCNGNNCGCPPSVTDNCTCIKSSKADNCDCYKTTIPPVTAAPTSAPTTGIGSATGIGTWPGLV